MAFSGYEFIFDGVPGMKYDLLLYDIGSNKQSDSVSFPSAGKIIEDRISRSPTSLLYGVEQNESLSFPLTFVASPARMESGVPYDRFEVETISSWLTGHQTWKTLKIVQPDLESVRYKCLITDFKEVSFGNFQWAFSCTVTCDSPYAYQSTQEIEYWCGPKIADLKTLLQAAKNANNGAPAMLNTLTLALLYPVPAAGSELYFAADAKGTHFADSTPPSPNLTDFKDKLKLLVKDPAVPDASKLSWAEIQYYFIHGKVANSILDASRESREYYWWAKGGAGKAVSLIPNADLSVYIAAFTEAAYRAHFNGNTHAWDELTSAKVDALRLVQNDNGATSYVTAPTLPKFDTPALLLELQAKYAALLQAMSAAAGQSGEPLPAVPSPTWLQVQHYFNKGELKSDADLVADPTIDYWWKTKDEKAAVDLTPLEKYQQFMAKLQEVVEGKTPADDFKWWTTAAVLNDLEFLDSAGAPFTAETAGNTVVNSWDALITDATDVYFPNGTPLVMTWYQVEMIILEGWSDPDPDAAKAYIEGDPYYFTAPSWASGGGFALKALRPSPAELLRAMGQLMGELSAELPLATAETRAALLLEPASALAAFSGTTEILFRNRSSYNGIYYPIVEIELETARSIEIVNHSNNGTTFKFSNLPSAVHKITVDNKNKVITNDAGLNLYDHFNFGYLGLVRGDNHLTVTGQCNLKFICDFPANVGG